MEEGGAEGERVPLREADSSAGGEEQQSAGATAGGGGGGEELQWSTVDGPLGAQEEEASNLARNFFYGGFFLLPWLWFVNCFYFWPVLRRWHSDPPTRFYIVWSGVGCVTFTIVVLAWSLTYAIGGESLLGSRWKHFAVYNLADKYSMAWTQ